jgi:membrane-bound metal-dependent hydrolase YbcI (DUF457 family)
MILGHTGLALASKRVAPDTSLGALAFATQWLDELWPILVLLGIEHLRVTPGAMAANSLTFDHYPWSHSLAMAVLWGIVIGVIYLALRRRRTGALVVGALVVSHWFLDAPMHRPDLPLWPGSTVMIGASLWNSVTATIAIELLIFGVGVLIYLRTTRAKDRVGRWGLWAMIAVLLLVFASGFVSPPPMDARAVAIGALGLWLFVPWSWWVDRHRESIREFTDSPRTVRAAR